MKLVKLLILLTINGTLCLTTVEFRKAAARRVQKHLKKLRKNRIFVKNPWQQKVSKEVAKLTLKNSINPKFIKHCAHCFKILRFPFYGLNRQRGLCETLVNHKEKPCGNLYQKIYT